MASNPYVNRVVYGNQVLIDLTNDTVNASSLLAGVMAHGADGSVVTGTLQLSYHITLHNAQYEQLTEQQKTDPSCWYYIDDATSVSADIKDNVVAGTSVWSSLKTNAELQAIVDAIAAQYDATETYNIGDLCAYGKQVYICNTDNTTGTWDSAKWTERSIAELIKKNSDDISLLNSKSLKLLWENQSPVASMGATTLQLSSDDYDALIFVCSYSTSTDRCMSDFIPKGMPLLMTTVVGNSTYSSYAREFIPNNSDYSKINASSGYYTGSANISVMIPQKIYGMKF